MVSSGCFGMGELQSRSAVVGGNRAARSLPVSAYPTTDFCIDGRAGLFLMDLTRQTAGSTISVMFAEMIHGLDALAAQNASPEPYMGDRILPPLTENQEFVSSWDIDRAYDEALEKSAMVDRCTYGQAEKGASVPLRVWERAPGQAKGTIVPDHELDVVLNHPSPDPVMGSRDELVTRTVLHNLLVGWALTGIRRGMDISGAQGSTKVVGLEAEDPREVFPVPSKEFKVAQWNYRDGNGRSLAWRREDMVAWRRHDPRNNLVGRSVLQSLALTVDQSVEAARTQYLRTLRDGRPSMILHSTEIKDRDKAQEVERKINARQVANRGGIMMLAGQETLISGGMSESDLGLLNSMAFSRDMIATAYGYLAAGFSNDAATYSNAGIFILHEWALVQQTMARWTDTLTGFLFSREDQARFYIEADYSGVQVLQDANMEKLKVLASAAFKGTSTNDLIRALNLPMPLEATGDLVLVPGKLQDLAAGMGLSDG